MLSSLRKFNTDEIAQKRQEMISFFDQHGEAATKQAFGADRKVISRWRKRRTASGGKLAALVPISTRPHTVRRSTADPCIVAWIKNQRETHPRIGKEKLKPDLDEYCEKLSISTVSTSTIGNIIKQPVLLPKSGRVYHNPASKWAQNKAKRQSDYGFAILQHQQNMVIFCLIQWNGLLMASENISSALLMRK
jgi:hypothetical protein